MKNPSGCFTIPSGIKLALCFQLPFPLIRMRHYTNLLEKGGRASGPKSRIDGVTAKGFCHGLCVCCLSVQQVPCLLDQRTGGSRPLSRGYKRQTPFWQWRGSLSPGTPLCYTGVFDFLYNLVLSQLTWQDVSLSVSVV